jgi:YVTN family beta-propeller protein
MFAFVMVLALAFSFIQTTSASAVISTINVGGAPWGITYNSAKGEIIAVNSGSGKSLWVISDTTNAVTATIPLTVNPYRVEYDSGKNEIFVANYASNSVSIISDNTHELLATVAVGKAPASFAYDSGKNEIFVANSGENTVSVISDISNTVVANITVGSNPYDLAYDSAKGEIFVANSYGRSVSVISDSTNKVLATIPVGSGPLGIVYDSAKSEIFVANLNSNTVSVISDNTNSVIATIPVGEGPVPIAYDSNKGQIYVGNRDDGTVSVISDVDNTVVQTLTVGTTPYGLAYDSAKEEIFVANQGDGTISVISDASSVSPSANPSSGSPSSSVSPSSSPQDTVNPTTTPSQPGLTDILQQVWVPNPTNTAISVGVSAAVIGIVSFIFSAISDPLAGIGGSLGEKTRDMLPDKLKEWLEKTFESKREAEATEKIGSVFKPTLAEIIAYTVSIIILGISFSYVKVITLDQIWALLPIFIVTSIVVGFVQKIFTIIYLRHKGVWSEQAIWPLGLILFLFTTIAFKVPFSSPTRTNHTNKFTERLGATVAVAEILIGLGFAGIFFLLLELGYTSIGSAGLSMCIIGAFFGTFPISPIAGKEIFAHSKRNWLALFVITLILFIGWLFMI